MRKLTIILGSILVIAFIALGINHIVESKNNEIKLREIEIQSFSTKVDKLESQVNVLNKDLDKATTDKSQTQEELKRLSDEKAELERRKQELEAEKQAKIENAAKLASISQAIGNPAPVAAKAVQQPQGNLESIVRNAAVKNGLDPTWFWNLAKCESTWNPNNVNTGYWEDQFGKALGLGGVKHHPSGLYQHLTNYWPARAAAHGYAGASVFNAEANANVTASMWKSGSHLWECQ